MRAELEDGVSVEHHHVLALHVRSRVDQLDIWLRADDETASVARITPLAG